MSLHYAIPAKFIKKWVDERSKKQLESIQEQEGCPHLKQLKAHMSEQNAILCVHEIGGIAWKVRGHTAWYWHPQEDFKPLTCNQMAYRKSKETGKSAGIVPPIPGKNCKLCVEKIKARAS